MRRLRTARRSTTVIELAMVLVILSVALPPLMVAYTDAAAQSIRPSLAATAAFLAIERMDAVVFDRYRGNDAGGNTGYDRISAMATQTGATFLAGFSWKTEKEYVNADLTSSGSDVGYTLIRVTISWDSGSGNEEVVLERIFADF